MVCRQVDEIEDGNAAAGAEDEMVAAQIPQIRLRTQRDAIG